MGIIIYDYYKLVFIEFDFNFFFFVYVKNVIF